MRVMLLALAFAAGCTCGAPSVDERPASAFEHAVERLSTALCERAAACGQTPADRVANCIGEVKSGWLPPGQPAPAVDLILDVDTCVERIRQGRCEQPKFDALLPLEMVLSTRCPTAQLLPTGEPGDACAVNSPFRQCRGDRAGCVGDGGCVGVCQSDALGGAGQPMRFVAPWCLEPAILANDGGCVARLPRGAPCGFDGQCETLVCNQGFDAGSTCGGEPPLGACDFAHRCSLGFCSNGTCPRIANIGEACTLEVACPRGAICNLGRCAVVPRPGEACTPTVEACENTQCPETGLCPGEARTVPVGGPCRSPFDCGLPRGIGLTITCRLLSLSDAGRPTVGICGVPQPGDACLYDDGCPDETVCWSGRCTAAWVEPTCQQGPSCFVRECSDAGCVVQKSPTGAFCEPGGCASPTDICGFTRFDGGAPTCHRRPTAGQPCEVTSQCPRGLLCVRGVCTPGGGDGEPCLANGFCLDGGCNLGGFCDSKLPAPSCR